jgi:DNA-directed RNA polymerase subunit RPC12/RpoP
VYGKRLKDLLPPDCGFTETREILAWGHKYEDVVTPPTCTEDGYKTRTCTVCGHVRIDKGDPATGHDFGEWEVSEENHVRRCSKCDAVESAAHDYESVTTPPTCTEAGVITQTCKVCGHTKTSAGDPALGHDYKAEETAPTCTQAGTIKYTCSRCGNSYTEAGAPALGHDFGPWVSMDANNHKHDCSRCNYTESAPHKLTVSETAATCTAPGSKVSTCSDCGYTNTETIPALGHNYVAAETPPTCTEAGTITYTCSRCGDSYTNPGAPATGHTFGDWKDNGENHIRTCSKCNATETAAHTFTVTETAPTCTAEGSKVSTCAVCGHVNTEAIPALGHDYQAVVTAPTCTQAGYTTYTCSRCGNSYTEAGAPATGHTFGQWTSANNETHTRKCANCDVTETANHDFTVTEVPATPDASGTRTYTCKDCGFVKTETIPPLGHNYVGVETPPTCTEDGYITYTCTDCGDSYRNPGAPALGHAFGDWTDNGENHIRTCSRCNATETAAHTFTVTETAPTCSLEGKKVSTCSVCGKTETETIPALGHDYQAVVTEPTCTAAGFTTYTCSRCGNSYTEAGAPALGHVFGNWTDAGANHSRTCSRCNETETAAHSFTVEETAATCTEAGKKVSTCSVCGHTDTETLPALGHNYVAVETAPTCTEAGYTTYTCSRCGDSYTQAGAPATGHSFEAWESINNAEHSHKCSKCGITETAEHDFTVTEVPATPDASGSRTYTCKVCGYVKIETIPPLGHNYVGVETPPTCTEDGYITYTCTDCGDSYRNPGAPALGHSWGAWTDNGENQIHTCSRCGVTETSAHSYTETVTEPTCTEDGKKVYVCADCGKTVTEIIPAVGHNYTETVVAPTATEGGYTLHTCSVCGESYKDNFTDPVGPTGLKGDVDLDGDVDNADLIQIARHVVHIITLTDRRFWAGDMNDDGTIDNQDIILHARKLVGL